MQYAWLCLAALGAGAVNAVAGGGTLLTFPALLAVVSEIMANGTSTVALLPGSIAGAWGFRRELAGCRRWIVWLTLPSLAGGAIGTLMVTRMQEQVFRAAVPWLILIAATLFLLQPLIARYFQTHAFHGATSPKMLGAIVVLQLLIGIYGGYFGAGIGILMLSSLSFLGLANIHQTNSLKTYLAFCINAVAAGMFVQAGKVDWRYAGAMSIMAILGGYLGARFSLRLKPKWVRMLVIILGFSMAGYYFWKQW